MIDIYSVKGKVQMGYKTRTPGVQIFAGYKKSKWGTVPQNGVQLATLYPRYLKKIFEKDIKKNF